MQKPLWFAMDQFMSSDWGQNGEMEAVIYQCPIMGKEVQAWFADAPSDDHTYVSLRCPACARVHLVNRSGRALGSLRP
jgi:hypothetical protein